MTGRDPHAPTRRRSSRWCDRFGDIALGSSLRRKVHGLSASWASEVFFLTIFRLGDFLPFPYSQKGGLQPEEENHPHGKSI